MSVVDVCLDASEFFLPILGRRLTPRRVLLNVRLAHGAVSKVALAG